MTTPDIHQFIGRIYDAAIDPAHWESLMVDIADAVGGSVGVLVMNHDGIPGYALVRRISHSSEDQHPPIETFSGTNTIARYTRIPPDILDCYIREFFLEKDLWYQKIREKCRSGSVFSGADLVSARELKKTDFYNEILKPGDGGRLLGCIIHMDSQYLTGMTVSRPWGWRDFGEEEKSFIKLLLPHLNRAWKLQSHLAESRKIRISMEESIQLSSTGIILIDESLRIIQLNHYASTILSRQDGLMQNNGKLMAMDWNENSMLNKHISQSIETAKQNEGSAGAGVRISRPSGKLPYQLMISPLNLHSDCFLISPDAAVCVYVHDPDEQSLLSDNLLRDLYSLTPGECKVARLVYQGLSPREISTKLGISLSTARSHLYSIMAKSGTRSQSGLVKLLARGPGTLSERVAET